MKTFLISCFLLSLFSCCEAVVKYQNERNYKLDLLKVAPPPDLPEHPNNPPGKGYVWIKGHWVWQNQYVWLPGYWALPPNPYSRWLPGSWQQTTGGWVWIPGRWT